MATNRCRYTRYVLSFEGGINKVYCVMQIWHFEQTSKYDRNVPGSGLFADMVNNLLAVKIANSGYPPGVETDEQKATYKRDVEEHEGITLGEISDNPAKKCTSKLSVNSFWGKLVSCSRFF